LVDYKINADLEDYIQVQIYEKAVEMVDYYQLGDIPSALKTFDKVEAWIKLHHYYFR